MGITLTSKTINSTYDSLLKLSDNDSLTGAFKVITDGLGNDTGVSLNNTGDVTISGTLTVNTRINTPLLQLTGGTGTQGELSWNADEETLDLINNGAVLQLGQEVHIHVRNNSVTTAIPNGTPVYVAGTLGASGRLKVDPMIADGSVAPEYFIGVTTEEIEADGDGKVTFLGKVRGFDTSGYTEGSKLYVSETVAGGWQTTEPTAPHPKLEVAFTVNSTNNGTLFVRSQNGHYLTDTHDINITSVADKDLLVYDSALGIWKNSKTLGDITTGNITTSGTVDGVDISVFKSDYDNHNHDSRYYTETEIDNTLVNYQLTSEKGQALGYAPLDSGAKIDESYLPDSIVGQVEYQGTWNAATNTPTLSTVTPPKGHYYIVSVAGTFDSIDYAVGDWIISDGIVWSKVDNTDAVTNFNGRLGAILPLSTDYDSFYYTKTLLDGGQLDSRYYTETEIGNFFSGGTAIAGYNKGNWDTAFGWGNHAIQGYLNKNADVIFDQAATRKIIFNSDTNFGSDKAFIYFNENSTFHRTGTENVRFSIGAFNDFANSSVHSDAVDIQGGARLFLNVGTWDSELDTEIGTPATGAYLDAEPIQFAVNNVKAISVTSDGYLKAHNNLIVSGTTSLQNMSMSGSLTVSSADVSFAGTSNTSTFSQSNVFNGSATFNDDITLNHSATGQSVNGITITDTDNAYTGVLSVKSGNKLSWNGNALLTTLTANYVAIGGDTMTGNLTISNTAPLLYLKDSNSTGATNSYGQVKWYDSTNAELAAVGYYGADSKFYIDAKGSDVYMPFGGANSVTINGTGINVSGNTVLHSGNYTSYTDSKYLRSDTSDTMDGSLYIVPTSANPALNLGRATGTPNIKSSDSYLLMDSNGSVAGLNWYTSDNVILANGGGNVGIGTTSPTTGKLVVHSGDIEVRDSTGNSGGRIKAFDNYHSIYFREGAQNRTNYYQYGGTLSSGLGHRFLTGGTSQSLRMQIADDGIYMVNNVGIGTTSPSEKLHVQYGNVSIYDNSMVVGAGSTKLKMGYNGSYNSGISSYIASGQPGVDRVNLGFHVTTYSGGLKTFYEAMTLKDNGYLGIGTTSPAEKLQVAGNIFTAADSTAHQIRCYHDDNSYSELVGYGVRFGRSASYMRPANSNAYMLTVGDNSYRWNEIRTYSNEHNWYAGGTFMARLNSTGLGIGTTSPNGKFTTVGTYATVTHSLAANSAISISSMGVNGSGFNAFTIGQANSTNNSGVMRFYYAGSGSGSNYLGLGFYANDDKFVIKATGQVAVNSTSVVDDTQFLVFTDGRQYGQVIKHARNTTTSLYNDTLFMYNSANSDSYFCSLGMSTYGSDGQHHRAAIRAYHDAGAGNYAGWLDFFIRDTSGGFTSKARLRYNGDFHADGDVIAYSTTISDKRLKDDVQTIDGGLDKVKSLRGVSYVWNNGSRKGQKDLGLIAQEVEQVLPELVREKEMPLMDDSGEKYKTVDYEKMVGVLIEAVKELSAEVEQLKNR